MKTFRKSLLLVGALALTGASYAQSLDYNAPTGNSNYGTGTATANTAVGAGCGSASTTGSNNSIFGSNAATTITNGSKNTCIGFGAGAGAVYSGVNNTFVGYEAGINSGTGSNNTIIGSSAGSWAVGSNNIFLGNSAGFLTYGAASPISNKLYIDVIGTSTPLIGGDFSARTATINGAFNVNTTNVTPFAIQNGATNLLQVAGTGATTINAPAATGLTINSQVTGYGYVTLINVNNNNMTAKAFVTALNGLDKFVVGGDGSLLLNTTSSSRSPIKITNSTLVGTGAYSQTPFELMTNGTMFIGTTRPKTAPYVGGTVMLTVGGTIVAQEIYVETSDWADYVFKKDYKLMPLSSVEKYISSNQHLPNIPSANEIETKGQSLGSLQVKQMEKIEELTLYLIELNKKMEAQDNKLESLEKQNKQLSTELAGMKNN